jgi:Tol biopolymer transport system component
VRGAPAAFIAFDPPGRLPFHMGQPPGTASSACPFVPAWAPDETKMVFAMVTNPPVGTAKQNIYTANADGTHVHQLTHEASLDFHDGSPDWGPHPLAT